MTRALRSLALVVAAGALAATLVTGYFTNDLLPLPANTEVANAPLAKRVLLVVLDGLRHDTALETPIMPNLRRLAARGAGGVARTGELTMSELGVRCIGTGVTPTLADFLHLQPVTFDNPLAALAARGGRVALVGSGTWGPQFGAFAAIHFPHDQEMELAEVKDGVDGPDRIYMQQALAVIGGGDWDLLVVHLPGIDNASHRWTAFSEKFRVKARATDGDLQRLVDAAGPDTTVIVTSDHGTSERGNHGGGEPDARLTPIVLAGPGIAAGVTLSARQIDIAPTLAVLLGLPIPATSEGRVMLTALAVPEAVRARIAAANQAQLERYARAYATARSLTPPRLDGDDPYALSDWLAAVRSEASLVPALWAGVLAAGAALLLIGGGLPRSRPALALWAVVGVLAALGAAEVAPALATAAAAVVAVVALAWLEPGLRRVRPIAWMVVAIAVIEVALAEWRLHYRVAELALDDLERKLHTTSEMMAAVVVGVAVMIAAWWWRGRRRGRRRDGGATRDWAWLTLAAIFAVSAPGDLLALPVGIGAGVFAVLVLVEHEHLPAALVLIGVTILALACERLPALDWEPLAILAPPACVALGVPPLGRLGRRAFIPLAVVAVAAAVVRAAGVPTGIYQALLGAGGLTLVALPLAQPRAACAETLGYAALVLVAVLCRPAQVPGVLALALAARVLGKLAARVTDEPAAVLGASLFAVGIRMAFLALFEHAFSFSKLELWLAFVGTENDKVVGAIVIVLKFVLAFVVTLGLVTADLAPRVRWRVIEVCGAFMLLRVAHIVMSMTVARGTVHSPYHEVGPMFLTLVMAASVAFFALLLGAVELGGPGRWMKRSSSLPASR